MRFLIVALLLSCSLPAVALSDAVCINGRCGIRQPKVVVQNVTQNVTVVSAQDHANQLAATNTFSHCGRRGGGFEGLGFSSAGPDAACRNACFWGQRRVREIGTAWCPARRGWIAVVRYE